MKYAILVYEPLEGSGSPIEVWNEYHAKYGATGRLKSGEQLHEPSMATTVRVRDGKLVTTDGPFAETKEHLGGFYIYECDNIDQAIQFASECPMAKAGSMEIRPIVEGGS